MNIRQTVRWFLFLGCIVMGLLYLNGAAGSWWVSWGPPSDYPKAWEQQAVTRVCISSIFLFSAPMAFIALKKGFNLKRSKFKYVWLFAIVISASYPNLREFIKVDSCLDSGGIWSEEYFECRNE